MVIDFTEIMDVYREKTVEVHTVFEPETLPISSGCSHRLTEDKKIGNHMLYQRIFELRLKWWATPYDRWNLYDQILFTEIIQNNK
jgi:hypothetical protein